MGVLCGRDAAEAAEWRERYPGAVTTSAEVRELVDASDDAIVAALPKSRRPAAGN